jgi:hypothetical protein
MASRGFKRVLGGLAASSLMLSSTVAIASNPAPVPQANPWAVLSALSGGAPAAAMCGAAAAAAASGTQSPTGCVLPVVDAAPPPPPPAEAPPPIPAAVESGGISPLILGLLAVAAGVGIYLAVHNHHHANSPA